MAKKFRLDLRKELRALASSIQDENAHRLLESLSITGAEIAPRKTERGSGQLPRRVRISGAIVKRAQLVGRVGIRTGEMLRDLVRRSNLKITRLSFKIMPSNEVFKRWTIFNRGDDRQVARPVSGIPAATVDEAKAILRKRVAEQYAKHLRGAVL